MSAEAEAEQAHPGYLSRIPTTARGSVHRVCGLASFGISSPWFTSLPGRTDFVVGHGQVPHAHRGGRRNRGYLSGVKRTGKMDTRNRSKWHSVG